MNISIEGVNIQEGLTRFGKNEKLYIKSLLRFANDYPPPADDTNMEERKSYSHMIKGVAGNLGIYDLAESAARAEINLTDNGIFSDMLAKMDKMSAIINETLAEHSDLYQGKTVANKPRGNQDELTKLIAELREAALEYDPTACEKAIEKLRSFDWGDLKTPDFDALAKAVDEYDLDDIGDILGEE